MIIEVPSNPGHSDSVIYQIITKKCNTSNIPSMNWISTYFKSVTGCPERTVKTRRIWRSSERYKYCPLQRFLEIRTCMKQEQCLWDAKAYFHSLFWYLIIAVSILLNMSCNSVFEKGDQRWCQNIFLQSDIATAILCCFFVLQYKK